MHKLKKLTIFFCLFHFLGIFYSLAFASEVLVSTDSTIKEDLNASILTYSPSCMLMESKTGNILYEKNARGKMSPASTTKIMTAILTLENCKLEDMATVSYNAVHSIPSGYTYANLQVGEELSISDLLHVLLIPSANDAAIVLAEHIAGSVESFSSMMNTKAVEIGCINTNFVNPNGIENENHYSCSYDLTLMGKYAMENDIFRSIVSKTRYTLPTSNKYDKEDRIFNTTNELIKEDHRNAANNYYLPYCNGMKTGYTDKAKNCIVASASKDGMDFIVTILGADRTDTGLFARAVDCKTLFSYAFENYGYVDLLEEGSKIEQIKITNGTEETNNLEVLVEDSLSVLAKKSTDPNSITPTVTIQENLKAPISKNTKIGTISYEIEDTTYTIDLVAGNDVVLSKTAYTYISIGVVLILIFLIYRLLSIGNHKNSSSRGKKNKNYKKKKRAKHRKDKNKYLYW